MSKKIIVRKDYIEKVKPFIGTDLIKVFVGQRRVGKSCILKMIINYLKEQDSASNIIYINKESVEFNFIYDDKTLYEYIELKLSKTNNNYIFIDEVQEIQNFEKILRNYYDKPHIDMFCTGSNANFLSGDLATYLSGRYVQIKVNILSYSEFLEFHKIEDNNNSLHKYLKWGGLPYIKNLIKDDEIIFDYLQNIISTIIYKDVIYRYKIRNVEFFDNLLLYVANNIGNIFTATRISDYLKSQHIDISPKVILNYLYYLQNAFLIYKLKRVDLVGKKIFETNNKYFFEDWGLRNALVGLNQYSVYSVLENVVFTHLKSLGYSISVGVVKDKEIDFVAVKSGLKVYVQVTYYITDEKVKEREFGNLLLIKDNYPKYVVSLDEYTIGNFKGVQHIHLRDFLTNDKL